MKNIIKVAMAQYSPIFLNKNETFLLTVKLIHEAAQSNSQIIVFPETWFPGYPAWIDSAPKSAIWNYSPTKKVFKRLYDNSLELNSPEISEILNLSVKFKIVVVMGLNERYKAGLFNSVIIFNPHDKSLNIRRKLVPTYTERLIWSPGDLSKNSFIITPEFSVGAVICWEHWMPAMRLYMHSLDEDIHCALWPSVNPVHLLASQHYSFEGNCFTLASGMILTKNDIIEGFKSIPDYDREGLDFLESIEINYDEYLYNGGSVCIKPDSILLNKQCFNERRLVFEEIDLGLITESKMYLDVNNHYSRPDIFKLNVNQNSITNIY